MRKFWVLLAGFAALIILIISASFFIDAPLRAYTERKLNKSLKGYTVRIEKLTFHPVGFSLDLENIVLVQNTHPDPPVAKISQWTASVHWHALLFGRLVNDQYILRPTFHITRSQTKQEAEDEVPVEERGWQDAVEGIYPFKINQVRVVDADVTYLDEANPARPLRLQDLNLKATNIRNVRHRDQEYPSDISLDGILFDSGRIRITGKADFLAEPHVGIKGTLFLEQIQLDHLLPLTGQYNVQLRGGTMWAEGDVEYAPRTKFVELKRMAIDGARVDYVHAEETKAMERQTGKQAVSAAKKLNNHSEILIRVDQIEIVNSELGFVNKATEPDYRVFLADAKIDLENFSNRFSEGTALINLKGKFMGTGDTIVSGTFRPERESPDLDLKVQIANTQIRSMNDLLRAYGNFDVVAGLFSMYSELTVKSGTIQGYVKPLFRNLDVFDQDQDSEKGLFRKHYERVVGGLSSLLENAPRNEVATKVDISGRLENPEVDTWQGVTRLIQNAFFQAIFPGFERESRPKDNRPQHG